MPQAFRQLNPALVLTFFPENGKRKREKPRQYWSDTILEDQQNIEII